MKIYPGVTIISHEGDRLPEIGDIYAGSFLGCPHDIGERVHISCNCSFVGQGKLYIGNDCTFGPNVVVYTSSPILDKEVAGNKYVKDFRVEVSSVIIGDHVFVGAGTVVHQGVTIQDHVVIGAQSLVLTDIIDSGFYVGNPLRRVR